MLQISENFPQKEEANFSQELQSALKKPWVFMIIKGQHQKSRMPFTALLPGRFFYACFPNPLVIVEADNVCPFSAASHC